MYSPPDMLCHLLNHLHSPFSRGCIFYLTSFLSTTTFWWQVSFFSWFLVFFVALLFACHRWCVSLFFLLCNTNNKIINQEESNSHLFFPAGVLVLPPELRRLSWRHLLWCSKFIYYLALLLPFALYTFCAVLCSLFGPLYKLTFVLLAVFIPAPLISRFCRFASFYQVPVIGACVFLPFKVLPWLFGTVASCVPCCLPLRFLCVFFWPRHSQT